VTHCQPIELLELLFQFILSAHKLSQVLLKEHNGTKEGIETKMAQVNGILQRIPKEA